ncbi:unnamed protein product [Diamesa hyperborea]
MEYYAIYAPSAERDDFVFTDKIDALKIFKTYKDSRLKSFKNRNDALKFAKIGLSSIVQDVKSPLSQKSLEKSNFPAPKSQDLVKFRKDIEANNIDKVYKTIWSNPRYLVSSGDTPSIMKEGPRYNALHIAAMNNLPKMAKLILQTLEQTSFIELLHGCKDSNADELSQLLLESYLNTPDKSRNETPLHFAAKLGHLDVIEVLISYPLCKMKVNSEGLFPKDIICARNGNANNVLIAAIEELLKERFFVPVLRSNDNTVQPMIGKPFTPNNMPTNFNKDPLSPSMEIKAYAGPMDKEQAQTFQRRWKTPPRLIPKKHIRLTNTEKGLELIGRGLAQEQGIEWKEFWDFLGRFVDIRSDDGLQCFENYLKQKEKILELNENNSEMNKSPEKSKLNDSLGLGAICAGFYSMDINNEIADKTPNDDEYFTPPESPSKLNLYSDDEVSVFEESLEHLEDQKIFRLFIDGEEPTKTDLDVLNALGDTFIVDETKYPLVRDWLRAVKLLQSKSKEISLPYKFRIYTPKLKKFNSYQ